MKWLLRMLLYPWIIRRRRDHFRLVDARYRRWMKEHSSAEAYNTYYYGNHAGPPPPAPSPLRPDYARWPTKQAMATGLWPKMSEASGRIVEPTFTVVEKPTLDPGYVVGDGPQRIQRMTSEERKKLMKMTPLGKAGIMLPEPSLPSLRIGTGFNTGMSDVVPPPGPGHWRDGGVPDSELLNEIHYRLRAMGEDWISMV